MVHAEPAGAEQIRLGRRERAPPGVDQTAVGEGSDGPLDLPGLPEDGQRPAELFEGGVVLPRLLQDRRALDACAGGLHPFELEHGRVDLTERGAGLAAQHEGGGEAHPCLSRPGPAASPPTRCRQPPLVLATAIDRLDPDIVVVAAAGNHGLLAEGPGLSEEEARRQRNKPARPAALDDVIAVGAADDDGRPALFTPQNAPWIDVYAPGVNITSTFLEGTVDAAISGGEPRPKEFHGYATWSGSSFSAALVSGAIAAGTVPGRTPARAVWKELEMRAVREEAAKNAGEEPARFAGLHGDQQPLRSRPPFLGVLVRREGG